MTDIHPMAIVDSRAKIGENVKIGPFSIIGPNVQIGDNCLLESNVKIEGHTKIGTNNHFFHSSVIGTQCQDLKYKGEPTRLTIGNNNIFREFVTVNCSATLEEDTTIGDNCYLMAYCHIAHNCHLGNNIIMANVSTLAGHITIEDYVTVGGLVAIHQFVRIGKYAFIGGLSGIKKDVPPYVRGQGVPFHPAGLNNIGLRRKGFSSETVTAIKQVYKIIYRSKYNVSQALEAAEQLRDITPEQKYFLDFIRNSGRGISK